MPPPATHTEVELDHIVDLMHRQDHVIIRRQLGSYFKPIDELKITISFMEQCSFQLLNSISFNSSINLNPFFWLPRLPKETMLQLEDKLSVIDLRCKVDDGVVDKFYEDVNHRGQHQVDDSLTGPIRSKQQEQYRTYQKKHRK